MCALGFIVSSLLWYNVASIQPELQQSESTNANALTWKAAGDDIASRPTGYKADNANKGKMIPIGHWDKAWWFATSDQGWEFAEGLLKKMAHNLQSEGVDNMHAFVGLKARIDTFGYFKAKKRVRGNTSKTIPTKRRITGGNHSTLGEWQSPSHQPRIKHVSNTAFIKFII
eukprot:520827_1